jgi:hypothetical protein
MMDRWPEYDTGEPFCQKVLDSGGRLKFIEVGKVSMGEPFTEKPCNYGGLVWHTWYSGRVQTVTSIVGKEVEPNYHDAVKRKLRERYDLAY